MNIRKRLRFAKLILAITMAFTLSACEMSPELMDFLMGLASEFGGVSMMGESNQYSQVGAMVGTQMRTFLMESTREDQPARDLTANMEQNANRDAAQSAAAFAQQQDFYQLFAAMNPSQANATPPSSSNNNSQQTLSLLGTYASQDSR